MVHSSQSIRRPKWLVEATRKLCRAVLGVDPVRSEMELVREKTAVVDLTLRSEVLCAAAIRVWRSSGHTDSIPKDDQEWLDLQSAIDQFRPQTISRKTKTVS